MAEGEVVRMARLRAILKILRQLDIVASEMQLTPSDTQLYNYNIVSPPGPSLLKLLSEIFFSESSARVAMYMAREGAATALILTRRLGLSKAAVYRALERLEAIGLVEPITTFRNAGKKPVTVWRVLDATADQVQRAILLHNRLRNPKYRVAERLAQTLLQTYIPPHRPEITVREIWVKVRELKVPYAAPDVVDIVAHLLQQRGVKVWR